MARGPLSQVSQLSQVRAAVEAAPEHRPEPPRPLARELPDPLPFPIDALGSTLAPAAKGIREKVQAPPAICGASVLAVASLATQAHADVQLPGVRRPRPLSLFVVTIAESGERKSSCDDEALRPVRKREIALREKHDADLPRYRNQLEAWNKTRTHALGKARGSVAAAAAALEDIGPEPHPPLKPMLTCPEPTYEGLCLLLAAGQPAIGVFSAEGGQFVGGHALKDENKLRSATGLSCLWDGEPVRRVRVADGAIVLPGRRVALHLMVQPHVGDILFSDPVLRDQGVLSRILVTAGVNFDSGRIWKWPRSRSYFCK